MTCNHERTVSRWVETEDWYHGGTTGDRDWSDEVDRPWIQLEFGYGNLYDAKASSGSKI